MVRLSVARRRRAGRDLPRVAYVDSERVSPPFLALIARGQTDGREARAEASVSASRGLVLVLERRRRRRGRGCEGLAELTLVREWLAERGIEGEARERGCWDVNERDAHRRFKGRNMQEEGRRH